MSAYDDRLNAEAEKLKKRLAEIEEERRRASKQPGDILLFNAYRDPETRQATAKVVMQQVKKAADAASILKTTVPDIYSALKGE